VDAYLDKKVEHGRLSRKNADNYRPRLLMALDSLEEWGLAYTPDKIGEAEILHLLNVTFAHEKVSSRRWDMSIVSGFLEAHDNKIIKKMELVWPQDARVHVDWLTPEEAVAMLEAARPGVERLVIHLELRLWLRRVEVRRLRPEDVQPIRMLDPMTDQVFEGVVDVHGKGRGGGKWRTLAWAPESKEVLEEYDRQRAAMIARARQKNPQVEVPQEYVIYEKNGKLSGYSDSGLDTIVMRVAKRAGIVRKILNHTLRRTGARMAYFARVLLVEIMEGLGHSSEKETIKYLGLTVHELGRAQAKIHSFLQGVKERMKKGQGPQEPSGASRVSS